MISEWTHHLKDPIEKEKFNNSLINARSVLERLEDILTTLEKDVEKQERSPRAYDSPNWQYRQAHSNGFLQCLYKIKTLIKT